MKNLLTFSALLVLLASCSKKETQANHSQSDIDSINAARTKINDSIRSKNKFADFSGTHQFTHNSIKAAGTIHFKKIEGEADHYNVEGEIKSGKNHVDIKGFAAVVSDKHLNFTGEITQSLAENDKGKPYIRKGTKTFMSKDKGKTWRLQDMVNSSGFADYIDIHF